MSSLRSALLLSPGSDVIVSGVAFCPVCSKFNKNCVDFIETFEGRVPVCYQY